MEEMFSEKVLAIMLTVLAAAGIMAMVGAYYSPLSESGIKNTIALIDSTKGKPYELEFKKEIQPILAKDPLMVSDKIEIRGIKKRYESEELKKELMRAAK